MHRRRVIKSLAAAASGVSAGCLNLTPGTATETTDEPRPLRLERVRMRLRTPWGAAFHPRTGDLYVTERPGRIQQLTGRDTGLVRDLTGSTEQVGEGGLLGLVFDPLDPDRAFVYQTHAEDGVLTNRVLELDASRGFAVRRVLFDDIPAGQVHDGGRLAIGPENALYVTTGDAGNPAAAQNTDSLAGKILRITRDGDPHPRNPFGNAVFAYGFRNPQGLVSVDGRWYVTDHGPDYGDEFGRIEAGGNYGWPVVSGHSSESAYTNPLVSWTPTIAPASCAYYDGDIREWRGSFFVGALAGEHLRRLVVEDDEVVTQQALFTDLGRIRTTFTGPDGHLYLTTSNQDGRGNPAPTDDAVFRVRPP
ncbi:PQQ-dependent sugar dehydrogenase [Haloarchaeobius sp. TZWWS8]|uniref:PQQ-dependent sugar dehydrogenase n=1 Tax=Haloarchaeobius sp. TZWWS8 TaxID=3446121 RepID=UPI003EBC73DA